MRTPTPASTSTRAAPRQPLMHTDAEAARRAGLEEGRAQGQQQGREEGLKEGKEEGRKLGLEQGLEEGKLQGEQQARLKLEQETDIQRRAEEQRALDAAEASAKALQDLHAHLQQADESLQAKAELLAVDLAWTALTRLLADGAGKREAVAGMVRAVLDETRAQQIVRIGLAAADLALLQADLPSDFAGFELHADARVQSGGCIVETVAGALDGRLETRLQMLRQLLLSRPNAAGEEAS